MEAYSNKYNYCIKWNAKSGCTLFRRLFLHLHESELKNPPDNKWHNLGKEFPYNNNHNNNCYKINLVRNPYKRVVSMFTNKYCGNTKAAVLYDKIHLEKTTFFHFVKYLLECRKNNNWCDCHILQQSISYNPNDKIIKLENFNDDIINAYSTCELKYLLPEIDVFLKKINNNNEDNPLNITKKDYENKNFIGLTEFDHNYNGAWSDYTYFYNDEIAKMVQEIYQEDFDLYNYSKDFNI